jgi:class 3 adenylate cyclase
VSIVSTAGIRSHLAGKASGGRRLIAVVYADMVGYSRLISLDDAGTLRRLRTLRRALIDPAIRSTVATWCKLVGTRCWSRLTVLTAQSAAQ